MNFAADLTGLIDRLEPITAPDGVGRALMVMGAGRGVGASTVARELARLAAARARRGVWLFDLDFGAGRQARAARCTGPAYDAGFGQPPFWRIAPKTAPARLAARRSSARGLTVAHLQGRSDQIERVALRAAPDYWTALRGSIDLAVIDAPADAKAALALVADMDGVILVADARRPQFDGLAARRAAIEARGGVVAGLIVNRSAAAGRSAA